MSDPFFRPVVAGAAGATSFDAGLRTHMQRLFNYMAGGLAATGLVAYVVANTPLAGIIFGSPLRYVVMLAPLAFLFFLPGMNRYSLGQTKALFWGFCTVMGLSLSTVFLVYSQASIARAFFVTSADFAAMSLYGYTTKRDLTAMGAFMLMGLLGIIIAMVVNVILMWMGIPSPALVWAISVISVIIFTGLTAYDVQRIKQTYAEGWGRDANDKLAISGALSLYLDFINLFMSVLRLTGNSRN
jgi:FtsH-binding integral membrane protein